MGLKGGATTSAEGRSRGEVSTTFPNEVSRRIGANVKRLRGARKLTQEQMGKEFRGVSSPRISQIENGKENLTLEQLIEICEYFNEDIYQLFIREGLTIIDHKNEGG